MGFSCISRGMSGSDVRRHRAIKSLLRICPQPHARNPHRGVKLRPPSALKGMTDQHPPQQPPDVLDELTTQLLGCGGALSQIVSHAVQWEAAGKSAPDAAPVPDVTQALVRDALQDLSQHHAQYELRDPHRGHHIDLREHLPGPARSGRHVAALEAATPGTGPRRVRGARELPPLGGGTEH